MCRRCWRTSRPNPPRAKDAKPTGPAWTLNGRFDRVLLARGQYAAGVAANIVNDGQIYRSLSVTGTTAPAGSFSLQVSPAAPMAMSSPGNPASGGSRRLMVTAENAGALLRGLGIARTLEGGQLSVGGRFDDSTAAHRLSGTAEIKDFRVRNASGFGKLLQAMTLYGLVDVLRGPGIGFSQLTAPFQLNDGHLELDDARAFSSSLGLTAKGHIDLDDERIDMEGTIVPAYFFNSLLGNIPLIGRLFSPEQGGGLFAARYSLRGSLEDPAVFVNPLSALTPGFLRQIFGIF